MGTISGRARDLPSIRNFLDALRMAQPIILKSENVSLWDVGTNLNLAREMIRGDSCKRENQREGKLSGPRRGSKKTSQFVPTEGSLACYSSVVLMFILLIMILIARTIVIKKFMLLNLFGPLKKNLILVHPLSRLVKVGKKKLNLLLMFPSVIVYLMNCLNLEISN
jgi:hypothetical protein